MPHLLLALHCHAMMGMLALQLDSFLAKLPLQLLLCPCVLIALGKVSRIPPCGHPDPTHVELQVPAPKNPVKSTEQREQVTFTGPVDSVYLKAKDYVELDVGTGQPRVFACHGLLAGMLVTCSLPHMAVGRVLKAPLRACLAATHVGLDEVLKAATLSSAVCMCSGWRVRQLARYSLC